MEFIGSKLTSNLGNMIFYLGLFPTFDQLSDKITTEIEEAAAKNKETMKKMNKNEANEENGEMVEESKREEESRSKVGQAEDVGVGEMISSKTCWILQLRRHGRDCANFTHDKRDIADQHNRL